MFFLVRVPVATISIKLLRILMASGEFGPDSEKDEKLKKHFSSIASEKETVPEVSSEIEIDDAELEEPKKQSWFEKLFAGKEKQEAEPREAIKKVALPAVKVELVPEETIEQSIEITPENISEQDPERQLNLHREQQIKDEQITEQDFIEALEIPSEEPEQEPIEKNGSGFLATEVKKPQEIDTIEEPLPKAPNDLDNQKVVFEKLESKEKISKLEIARPESEVSSKESEDITENSIKDNLKELKVIVKKHVSETPKAEILVEPDKLTEAYQSVIESNAEQEEGSTEAAAGVVAKLNRRIGQLDKSQKTRKQTESTDLRKSIIAVSEKMSNDPNKTYKKQKTQVKNLMEILGFENVDQSLDLLIKQFGEEFISQLISQLLRILRQEKYELDPVAIRKARKQRKIKLRMSVGHCALKLASK